jgi:glycosyltransferase involved in cell wall biosynthesis
MAARSSDVDTEPLVSIIIPCYNGLPWVPHSVRSALRQTYRNIEVIVVDDGSTDGSRAVVEAEFGAAVRVIGITNSGAAAARNVGLAASSGDFVQFLDADNIMTPEKIARSVACFGAAPDTDIVFAAIHLPVAHDFVDETSFSAEEFQETVSDMVHRAYEKSFPGTGMPALEASQPLFRAGVLREHGAYDETLVVLDDVEVVCRLVLKGALVRHVPMVGIVYRDHPGERVSARIRFDDEAYHLVVLKLIELAREHGRLSGAVRDFAMLFLIWEAALGCVRKGRYRNAEEYVALARDISPRLPGPSVFRGVARVLGTVRALTVARVVLDVFVRVFPTRAKALLGPAAAT